LPSDRDPQKFQQAFFNEARAAGKLTHPNIVSLYDVIKEGERFYLVMEYVDGADLKSLPQKKVPLQIEKVVQILFQCAKALEYAHQNGVVHNDIKPSNIILSKKGEVKISDFGLASVKGGSAGQTGSLTGSVYYTPPEQLRNHPLTAQSDIFSLGVVMYELLTGTRPFVAETEVAVFFKILNENPEPFERYRPDVPGSLQEIVFRALEKDPAARHQSASQLASELSRAFDRLKSLEQEISVEEKYTVLKKINFFKEFTASELAEVIHATQWLEYDADSTIITEGEIEDCFYILVVGEVMVKKQGRPLAVLRSGDCFGEMAYLGKTKRTASIETLSETVLMKVHPSVMEQTSAATQLRFYTVFSGTLIHRLARATRILAGEE
jgi:serine/threonine protein kinase